jgi:hypothetical protein
MYSTIFGLTGDAPSMLPYFLLLFFSFFSSFLFISGFVAQRLLCGVVKFLLKCNVVEKVLKKVMRGNFQNIQSRRGNQFLMGWNVCCRLG